MKGGEIIYKVVSIFSGGGGLDQGFMQAGFCIILSTDIDKDCCETLNANFDHEVICDDINNLKFENNYADIIIGGSPCQSMSNANRVNNSKVIDDPKNKLILSYINKVKEINPQIFVFENVPQVITVNKGQFVKEFRESLPNYHIEVKILNSEEYGVAQKRKRAIFIGSRVGVIKHPELLKEKYTVKDAFYGLTNKTPNQLDISKSKEDVIHKMSFIPPGGNWEYIPDELKGKLSKKTTHSVYYKRLTYKEPSITIVNFRKNMILHPQENRIISVREAARLQGFPDDYIFYGSLASKQQMVANAVPVSMSKIIGLHILKYLQESNIKGV